MKLPHKVLFVIFIVFALISLSCQAFSNLASEPTSTAYPKTTREIATIPSPTPVPGSFSSSSGSSHSGDVLFHDDFSNPGTGWDESTDESGTTGYVDGAYRISISTDNYYYWSNPGLFYEDVIVEVTAKLETGSTQNDMGVICRLLDNSNFYFMTVSSDGYYQIAKFIDGEEKFVGMEEYGYNSEAIKENDVNTVRAECIGDELALFANDIELARVNDSDFKSGDVGLIAGTYDEPNVSVLFDNFSVYVP